MKLYRYYNARSGKQGKPFGSCEEHMEYRNDPEHMVLEILEEDYDLCDLCEYGKELANMERN